MRTSKTIKLTILLSAPFSDRPKICKARTFMTLIFPRKQIPRTCHKIHANRPPLLTDYLSSAKINSILFCCSELSIVIFLNRYGPTNHSVGVQNNICLVKMSNIFDMSGSKLSEITTICYQMVAATPEGIFKTLEYYLSLWSDWC